MPRLFELTIIVVLLARSCLCYDNVDVNFFTNELNDAIRRTQSKLNYYHQHVEPNIGHIIQLHDSLQSKKFNLYEDIFQRDLKQSRDNVSKLCMDKVELLFDSLKKKDLWAISVIDSYGKLPSGILQGAINWPGEYSECLNSTNVAYNWTAKYCSVTGNKRNDQKLHFTYGICVPKDCNSDEIATIINIVLKSIPIVAMNFSLTGQNVVCQEPVKLDEPAKGLLIFLLIVASIITVATIVDVYRLYIHDSIFKNEIRNILIQIDDDTMNPTELENLIINDLDNTQPYPNEAKIFKVINTLSIVRNTKKIFNINPDKSQLSCLHSIRFLSLCWVILGHSYGFMTLFSNNPLISLDYVKSFPFTVITNGFLSVDTFFLISGILTSYMFLKESSKPNAKYSFGFFFKYYIHRFIRLSPPYFIVLMISIFLSKYSGSGPFFSQKGFEPDSCRHDWWRNVLYINNFFKPAEMCLGVSWYIANDMQFHWVAPVILIPLALGKYYVGILISSLFLLANIGSISTILYLNPGFENGLFGDHSNEFSEYIYFKPWARIGPFIVGLILGHLLFVKKTQIRAKINIAINNSLWFCSIIVCSLCIFILYPDFRNFPNMFYSRIAHIVYQSLSRIIWALGLSYIIYACETSNGGIVNRILTWKLWLPLSRLTYSAYLVHLTVILYNNTTLEHLFNIQNSTLIFNYVANLVLSYFVAFFVCVFFELPLIGLEKFIFKRN